MVLVVYLILGTLLVLCVGGYLAVGLYVYRSIRDQEESVGPVAVLLGTLWPITVPGMVLAFMVLLAWDFVSMLLRPLS